MAKHIIPATLGALSLFFNPECSGEKAAPLTKTFTLQIHEREAIDENVYVNARKLDVKVGKSLFATSRVNKWYHPVMVKVKNNTDHPVLLDSKGSNLPIHTIGDVYETVRHHNFFSRKANDSLRQQIDEHAMAEGPIEPGEVRVGVIFIEKQGDDEPDAISIINENHTLIQKYIL